MWRRAIYTVAAGLLACSISLIAPATESQQSIDGFKASTGKLAEHLRGIHSFQPGGCDVNALLSTVIVRSREPLVLAGDRVVAVGDYAVRPGDSVFDLVNALPARGSVRLGLLRKSARLTVKVQCLDSRVSQSIVIDALEAASTGNFLGCIQKVTDYSTRYVHNSGIYGLGRRCRIFAGIMSDEQADSSYVAYLTLKLQEIKYHPESVDEVRASYLSAQNELTKDGKPFLVDELRRQWSLATGEPLAPSVPALPQIPATPLSIPQVAAIVPARHPSTRCEDGHWVEEVLGDGAIVKLENGTLWRVDSADTVDSALWLPTTSIVICNGKLINTEDNESVDAEEIH
jgi:hypothetical protein